VQTGARPIESTAAPPGTPAWGAEWKKAVRDNYLSTAKPGTGVHGSFYAYRDVYLDLDPTYRDLRPSADAHDDRLPR
jgi:gluconate 2-dehydrogenase alpha chain